APDHPVFARRGGHLAVANLAALRAAGIGADTPDAAGGKFGHLPDGSLSGVLEGGAVYQVAAFAPKPGHADLAGALGAGSAAYAALGVGTIREAMIMPDELAAYQDAWVQGLLSVRARPLIRVGNELSAGQAIALIRGFGARSGVGDDWLRIWGLKFVLDGGVEGGALEQPYADDPANSGHLNWDPAVLTRVCTEAARRGWRVGTHAAGDRAVRTLLDVYEGVVAATGPLPPWTLVIEHALLSDPAQRERAVRGGSGSTGQHALLWTRGREMPTTGGPDRTRRVNPLNEWLAAGADLAAGTDIVRPFNPKVNVWGMVTRGTKSAGIQGPEHAIGVADAPRLYTLSTPAPHGGAGRRGGLPLGQPPGPARCSADPRAPDPGDLPGLTPAFTVVGGRPVHDPDKRLAR